MLHAVRIYYLNVHIYRTKKMSTILFGHTLKLPKNTSVSPAKPKQIIEEYNYKPISYSNSKTTTVISDHL